MESLTRQIDNTFNVLIVDNNSTDETQEIIDSFKNRLEIDFLVEHQVGRANARNRVLKVAKCSILAFIDDDCEAFSTWTENIKKSHRQFPQFLAIQGWVVSRPRNSPISIVVTNIREQVYRDNIYYGENGISHADLINKNNKYFYSLFLDTRNVSFNFKELKKIGLTFNTSFKHAEDLEFSKQILSRNKIIGFCSFIKVYHWERETIWAFMKQKFFSGIETKKTQKLWSKSYFPQRKSLWWTSRVDSFFLYASKENSYINVLKLSFLYFLQEVVYFMGKMYASVVE